MTRRFWRLAAGLMLLTATMGLAQEATETPTPAPMPSETSTETATETAAVTPTDTPIETPTATASETSTPSATVTPSGTNTETPSSTWTPTETLTATASATSSETATVTPTGTNSLTAPYTDSSTETPTPTPTAFHTNMTLWTEETFEGASGMHARVNGIMRLTLHRDGGAALILPGDPVLTGQFVLPDTLFIESTMKFSSGAAVLSIRDDGTDHYSARLDADGVVTLFRSGVVVAASTTRVNTSGGVVLGVYSIEQSVGVTINGVTALTSVDTNPLTTGTFTIGGSGLDGSGLLIDNLRVWTTEAMTRTVGLRNTPIPTQTHFFVDDAPFLQPNANHPFTGSEGLIVFREGGSFGLRFNAVDTTWRRFRRSVQDNGTYLDDWDTSPNGRWGMVNCVIAIIDPIEEIYFAADICRVDLNAQLVATALDVTGLQIVRTDPKFNSAGTRLFVRDWLTFQLYALTFNENTGTVGAPQPVGNFRCPSYAPVANSDLVICQVTGEERELILIDTAATPARTLAMTPRLFGQDPVGYVTVSSGALAIAADEAVCVVGSACKTTFHYLDLGQNGYVEQTAQTTRIAELVPDTQAGVLGYEDPQFMNNGDYVIINQRQFYDGGNCTLRLQIYALDLPAVGASPTFDTYSNPVGTNCTWTNQLDFHTVNSLAYILPPPTPTSTPTATATQQNNICAAANGNRSAVSLNSTQGEEFCPPGNTLTVRKTTNDTTPEAGEIITFQISVYNTANVNITDLQLRDILPTQLSYISSIASSGEYNSNTGIWSLGTLSASSGDPVEEILFISAQVASSLSLGVFFENTVTLLNYNPQTIAVNVENNRIRIDVACKAMIPINANYAANTRTAPSVNAPFTATPILQGSEVPIIDYVFTTDPIPLGENAEYSYGWYRLPDYRPPFGQYNERYIAAELVDDEGCQYISNPINFPSSTVVSGSLGGVLPALPTVASAYRDGQVNIPCTQIRDDLARLDCAAKVYLSYYAIFQAELGRPPTVRDLLGFYLVTELSNENSYAPEALLDATALNAYAGTCVASSNGNTSCDGNDLLVYFSESDAWVQLGNPSPEAIVDLTEFVRISVENNIQRRIDQLVANSVISSLITYQGLTPIAWGNWYYGSDGFNQIKSGTYPAMYCEFIYGVGNTPTTAFEYVFAVISQEQRSIAYPPPTNYRSAMIGTPARAAALPANTTFIDIVCPAS